jgi:formylglycine-generating enzyme required for sulfatase activity
MKRFRTLLFFAFLAFIFAYQPTRIWSKSSLSNPFVVWIPEGEFTRGSTSDDVMAAVELCLAYRSPGEDAYYCKEDTFYQETPARRIWLKRYGIDRFEVSNKLYKQCVDAGHCTLSKVSDNHNPLQRKDHPVVGVNWEQAARYCAYRGGRLPTEAEWEKAARGDSVNRFPWGMLANTRLSNHGPFEHEPKDGYLYTAPVHSFSQGKSLYGLHHMAGNVWEWVQDGFTNRYYESSPKHNPITQGDSDYRVIRGGSYYSLPHSIRVTARGFLEKETATVDLGFRCAYDTD